MRITNTAGGFTNQTFGQRLAIDAIVLDFTPIGLPDGVAWTPQTMISGAVADRDSQLRVEYQINSDGSTAMSAQPISR